MKEEEEYITVSKELQGEKRTPEKAACLKYYNFSCKKSTAISLIVTVGSFFSSGLFLSNKMRNITHGVLEK